jgi:hypothetical protein
MAGIRRSSCRCAWSAVDHPFIENFRDDLPDPLGAEALLAGDLVISPAFSEPREDALPALDLAQNIEPPAGFWSLFHNVPRFSGKAG